MPNPRVLRQGAIALAVLFVLVVTTGVLAPRVAALRLRAMAHARGLEATWRTLDVRWPAGARVTGLVLRAVASGDTVLVADSLDMTLRLGALLTGHARPASASLVRATVHLPPASEAGLDTLALEEGDARSAGVAASVRQRADALVRALLAPARTLPELHLLDVEIRRGEEPMLTLAAFDLAHDKSAVTLASTGTLHGESEVPFDLLLRWQRDDRLTARAEFRLGMPEAH